MTSRAAMSRSKMLADSGKHLGPERQDEYMHRAIFINSQVDPNEVRTVKQFLVRQGGGGEFIFSLKSSSIFFNLFFVVLSILSNILVLSI